MPKQIILRSFLRRKDFYFPFTECLVCRKTWTSLLCVGGFLCQSHTVKGSNCSQTRDHPDKLSIMFLLCLLCPVLHWVVPFCLRGSDNQTKRKMVRNRVNLVRPLSVIVHFIAVDQLDFHCMYLFHAIQVLSTMLSR